MSEARKCTCGGTEFEAHQIVRSIIKVDEYNNFIDEIEVYDASDPYGPYICVACDASYKEWENIPSTDED